MRTSHNKKPVCFLVWSTGFLLMLLLYGCLSDAEGPIVRNPGPGLLTPSSASPIATPTVDMGKARQAFNSGGELTYDEVLTLRRDVVGDPMAWSTYTDTNAINEAHEAYFARYNAFGKQLDNHRLAPSIGWVVFWSDENKGRTVLGTRMLTVAMSDPNSGVYRSIPIPSLHIYGVPSQVFRNMRPGQRIRFSGIFTGGYADTVTDVKYELLPDPEYVPTPTAAELSDLHVVITRTACYGSCPAYTLTVTNKGQVIFDGRRHTRVQGIAQETIDNAKLIAVLTEFKRVDFFSFRDAYPVLNQDGQSADIIVTTGGKTKTVHAGSPYPWILGILISRIDEIVKSEQWIK